MMDMNTTGDLVIDARNIGVTFKVQGGVIEAVRDVSFRLHKGQTIALVGEVGSGKSVTARAIMRLLSKRAMVSDQTEILYDGKDMARLPTDRNAPSARQPADDDLSGTDELAEPGLHHRPADRRGAAHPQQDHQGRRVDEGDRTADARCRSPTPNRGSTSIRTNCRAASGSA